MIETINRFLLWLTKVDRVDKYKADTFFRIRYIKALKDPYIILDNIQTILQGITYSRGGLFLHDWQSPARTLSKKKGRSKDLAIIWWFLLSECGYNPQLWVVYKVIWGIKIPRRIYCVCTDVLKQQQVVVCINHNYHIMSLRKAAEVIDPTETFIAAYPVEYFRLITSNQHL